MKRLEEVISEKERAYYISKYTQRPPSEFATIKISGECFANHTEVLMQDLYCLQQVGLTPIVLLGWGATLNKKLLELGITPKFHEGNRITDDVTLELILEIQEEVSAIVHHYNSKGLRLKNMSHDKVFSAIQKSESLGYVGTIVSLNSEIIQDSCISGTIPFILPLGFDGDQMYNINADDAARELVFAIKPEKYVVITPTAGILDKDGNIISKISIADTYPSLISETVVTGGMAKKLHEAKRTLEKMPLDYSIQLASPNHVLEELFTHKGSGTKIVSQYVIDELTEIDYKRVQKFHPSICAATRIDNSFHHYRFFVEEDYDGLIILEEGPYTYMHTCSVIPEMQHAKLEQALLTKMFDQVKGGVVWKVNTHSKQYDLYVHQITKEGGGMHQDGSESVFWVNIPKEKIPDAIHYALSK